MLGADLATQAHDLLVEVTDIALRLARQGRRVRIVTDHGWLLMPGGLPQAQLVAGLTVAGGKGHRVATLKEGEPTTYPRLPWSWDKGVLLATATGARAFYAGVEYAHGGVSPQECVLPVLDIVSEPAAAPVVIKPTWQRLRLKVEVQGGAGLMFDVRLGEDISGDSILPKGARSLDDLGQVGVLIPDEYQGKQVCLVVHPPRATPEPLAEWRTHDLRRSGVSALARLGFDSIVADKILAHQPAKLLGVAGVYQRYDFARERVAALNAWAAHCVTGTKLDNVVPLQRAR